MLTGERLAPVHPGDILRDHFLPDLGITAYRLAKGTGISSTHVHALLRGERGVTATTARRLGAYLGTTPEYWLDLQQQYDLEVSDTPEMQAALARIVTHPQAAAVLTAAQAESTLNALPMAA